MSSVLDGNTRHCVIVMLYNMMAPIEILIIELGSAVNWRKSFMELIIQILIFSFYCFKSLMVGVHHVFKVRPMVTVITHQEGNLQKDFWKAIIVQMFLGYIFTNSWTTFFTFFQCLPIKYTSVCFSFKFLQPNSIRFFNFNLLKNAFYGIYCAWNGWRSAVGCRFDIILQHMMKTIGKGLNAKDYIKIIDEIFFAWHLFLLPELGKLLSNKAEQLS